MSWNLIMGQSITRKCKDPTPYIKQEWEWSFSHFFVYFQTNEQKKSTEYCTDSSTLNVTKGFPQWFLCYCSIQNTSKVWLQEAAIPLLPELVSSHLASTVITMLLVDYKLWIVFRNLQTCIFFAKREQALIICALMYTHRVKWNHCCYNILYISSIFKQCSIIFVYEKSLLHLTPLLFSWGLFIAQNSQAYLTASILSSSQCSGR